ncbi:MAG: hypothetical protein HYU55_13410 [Nocardioides sp.]|nr:hypothetical protein [Nocardioides sp.]
MSSRSRILAAAVAATLALPLAVTGPAPATSAAPPGPQGWGPVKTLAANPRGEGLAVAADGTVTVVWATGAAPGSIVAVRRPAGGSWGDPVVIGRGTQPQVAVDRRGAVTVAWLTERAGRADGVAAARQRAGGRWTTPVRLTGDGATPYAAGEVVLDVNPRGDAVVAWASRDRRDRPWRVRSAYRPAGGRWSGPGAATPADGSRHPQVGLDDEGRTVLLLCRQRFGHPQVLRTQERAPAGSWTEPAVVTREGYSPELAVDSTGDALVAFSPDFTGVAAAFRPAGGVVAAGDTVYDVLVALDDAGDTFLGWGGYALLGAYRPGGGVWGEPATLSPDAGVEVLESTNAQVAPNGDVAVLWKQEARPLKVRLLTAG